MKRIAYLLILTATLGRISYSGHTETWYDLPMQKVVENAQEAGIPCEYWIRDDLEGVIKCEKTSNG